MCTRSAAHRPLALPCHAIFYCLLRAIITSANLNRKGLGRKSAHIHTLGFSTTHRSATYRSPVHNRRVLDQTRCCRAPRSESRRRAMMQSSAAAFGSTLGCVRHEVRYQCQAVTSPSTRLLLRCHGSGHEAHGPWQLLLSSALASSCHCMSHGALPAACCARSVEVCTAVN